MPRRSNQAPIINPEAKKYQDLYHNAGSNPDSFAKIVIKEFINKNIESSAISQEINAIEKAFSPDTSRLIIKSFLNTPFVFSDRVSLPLFKTCLDKVCLPVREINHQSELIQTLMLCKTKLYGSLVSDHKNIPQFKEMMIYFLEKTKALTANLSEDFLNLKYEIFDLLKLPKLDDKVKDAIITSLNLKSKALTSVVKSDNKTLISKIYERPESFSDQDQLKNGALHYACCLGNVDAIMILQGIAEINSSKNSFAHLPLNLFPSDRNEEKKKLLIFGNGLRDMQPPQKFIHTFKNLSDDGKKQLFSKFLEHKKFPNSASTLIPQELQDFFATFRRDEEAFQKLANLTKDKPENQEFIKLIDESGLFDQKFKDDLKFKSQTLAERLIESYESLDNDDEKKLFLSYVLQNINPESPSLESPSLKDEDLKDFFKIFLRNNDYEELFDKFRDGDKKFEDIRMQKEELIEPIHDEIDLEDFINFLYIFSSSDFKEKSEEIKGQVEGYVLDFKGESNLAFERAFDMPENHWALSNLYLNYPEETKEIFTLEKLEILLDSDLEIVQKQKLLIKVLEMDSDESEKLSLIESALKSTWSKNKMLFPNQESDEVKELLDKLNVQQITGILLETLFEEIDSKNLEYLKNKNADEKYFIKFLFESPRFNYEARSNFLDRSYEKNHNLVMQAINSNNEGSINLMQNLSINLIRLELEHNVFECSPELKAKLLSTALDSENINSEEKIALLTALFATNDQEKSNLIYDYFLNKDLASAQELLTQEVVVALFTSNLDQEKKLNLEIKILGYDGLDEEFKRSFYGYLPAEFRSALNLDPEYVKSEVELVLSGIIREVETQQGTDFSAIRAESRSPSPDQIPSQDSSSLVEVASNESSASNLGSSELTLSTTSSFSAIRNREGSSGSQSPDGQVVSAPSSPDGQVISAGSESPDERRGAPNSPSSITGATIGVGSSGPEISSAIAIVDNILSAEDCEELQKILTGRVFGGFRDVRSYASEEFIPDSPLKIFHVDYKKENPFGNDGVSASNGFLKERFHRENFDPLLEKIHRSNNKFNEKRLKSYLYAVLAISTGESNSIASFFECYDNLFNNKDIKFDGPGHGSWIARPEDYVKLKMIIKEMERIHDRSSEEGNPAFTEKNLHNWMRAQIQDRKIEEFNYLENKEFVQNLIKAFDDETTDPKKSELGIVKESFKKLLNQNTSFLDKLATFSVSTDEDKDKDLANHLLDDLFKKMASKNSSFGIVAKNLYDEQLKDLRDNLTTKIDAFKIKLSSVELSKLDTVDDHLILDLILEIPIEFDDILKRKLEGNSFEIEGKIEDFTEKLGTRKSILKFRKTCASQAEVYANKARELGASPAKKGTTR